MEMADHLKHAVMVLLDHVLNISVLIRGELLECISIALAQSNRSMIAEVIWSQWLHTF